MIRPTSAVAASLAVLLGACARLPLAPGAAGSAAPAAAAGPAGPARGEAEEALRAGRAAFLASRFADAAANLARAGELAPADPRPHLALAEVRVAQGDFVAAAAAADEAIRRGGGAEGHLWRGRALALARRHDEAVPGLERAIALDPAGRLAYAVLTAVHLNRGDDVEARRVHAAARAALGPDAAADALSVQLHSLAPDRVAAQEALDRCARGHAAMLDGDWEYARNEILVGLRFAPRYLWCMAGLGESMWRAGAPARGEQLLRAVIAAYPAAQAGLRADAQARLAELLLERRGDAAEAAALAREALAARGERAGLLALAGRACDAAGDAACAADAWRRLAAFPRAPEELRLAAEARLAAPAPVPAVVR